MSSILWLSHVAFSAVPELADGYYVEMHTNQVLARKKNSATTTTATIITATQNIYRPYVPIDNDFYASDFMIIWCVYT